MDLKYFERNLCKQIDVRQTHPHQSGFDLNLMAPFIRIHQYLCALWIQPRLAHPCKYDPYIQLNFIDTCLEGIEAQIAYRTSFFVILDEPALWAVGARIPASYFGCYVHIRHYLLLISSV